MQTLTTNIEIEKRKNIQRSFLGPNNKAAIGPWKVLIVRKLKAKIVLQKLRQCKIVRVDNPDQYTLVSVAFSIVLHTTQAEEFLNSNFLFSIILIINFCLASYSICHMFALLLLLCLFSIRLIFFNLILRNR